MNSSLRYDLIIEGSPQADIFRRFALQPIKEVRRPWNGLATSSLLNADGDCAFEVYKLDSLREGFQRIIYDRFRVVIVAPFNKVSDESLRFRPCFKTWTGWHDGGP